MYRSALKQFGQDIVQGLREGPLVFFAPIVAIVRLVESTREQLMCESEEKHRRRARARR